MKFFVVFLENLRNQKFILNFGYTFDHLTIASIGIGVRTILFKRLNHKLSIQILVKPTLQHIAILISR